MGQETSHVSRTFCAPSRHGVVPIATVAQRPNRLAGPVLGVMASIASRVPLAAAMLIPGALTLLLAFQNGGFDPGPTGVVGVQVILLAAVAVAVTPRLRDGWSGAAIAAAALLGAYIAWMTASQGWSDAPGRLPAEIDRALLYLGTLTLFITLAPGGAHVRLLLRGVAFAIVAVTVAALIARTLPEVITANQPEHPERLAYPVGYWNALGILTGVGAVLCAHLTSDLREPRWIRVWAAASMPLLATALYYTYSRGAAWATMLAILLYVMVGRPRGWLSAGLATIGPTLVALAYANPPGPLVAFPIDEAGIQRGEDIAMALVLCAGAAAVMRAATLSLDSRVERIRLGRSTRRLVGALVVLVILLGGAGATVTFDIPSEVQQRYEQFSERQTVRGAGGKDRFLAFGNNGRLDHWDTALEDFRSDRTRGTGAGTYQIGWLERRPEPLEVRDAHSLYLETLGEYGVVGLALLGSALLLMLGSSLLRARGPDRALWAACFAACFAWALHAAVDWDWELPGVTLWVFAVGGAALAGMPRVRSKRATSPGTPGEAPAARMRPSLPVRRTFGIAVRGALVVLLLVLAVGPAKTALAEARLEEAIEALYAGDCALAKERARASLDVRDRPSPYQVLAFCEMPTRPERAAAHMRTALQFDPRNWELHHNLAVALAKSGKDPRPRLGIVRRLNPLGDVPTHTRQLFVGVRGAAGYRQAAEAATLLLPTLHDPPVMTEDRAETR